MTELYLTNENRETNHNNTQRQLGGSTSIGKFKRTLISQNLRWTKLDIPSDIPAFILH